jgi:hypothetical protein
MVGTPTAGRAEGARVDPTYAFFGLNFNHRRLSITPGTTDLPGEYSGATTYTPASS